MTSSATRISTTMAGTMFTYDFMQNAFAAAGIVAVVCGLVGFFLVLRAQTFAGHALSHVGFAGATGAVLIGMSPLWGLIALTLRGRYRHGTAGRAAASARCGDRHRAGDVARPRPAVPALLHRLRDAGDRAAVRQHPRRRCGDGLDAAAARRCRLAALAAIARPLLFASLQPELAEAKGVSLRLVSVLFLAIVALGVAECAQIVGVLLVFALMVGPAAAAQRLTTRFWRGIALSVALALAEAWLGLVLAFYTDWPTSFWITSLSGGVYLVAVLAGWLASQRHARLLLRPWSD